MMGLLDRLGIFFCKTVWGGFWGTNVFTGVFDCEVAVVLNRLSAGETLSFLELSLLPISVVV